MKRLSIAALLLCLSSPLAAQEAPAEAEAEQAVEVPLADGPAQRVRAAFDRVPALAGLEVTFGAGVLSLSGTAQNTSDRADAALIASKVDGVLFVDNRVVVAEVSAAGDDTDDVGDGAVSDAAIREKLDRVFANVEELAQVSVQVRSGVVRLSGIVLASSAAENAEALARATPGVVYVENALEEERAVSERISPALARTKDVLRSFVATLPLLGVGLSIIAFFLLVGGFLTRLQFPFRRLEDKPLVLGIVKQFVRLGITGIGVVLVLELFDLTALVGAVLGTAGVAGLAIGFAFKDIVENYLASLMLSVRRPFEKGDWVTIDTLEGKVVRLTTRETVLMTLDGNHLRIPNAKVFGSVITNFTRNPLRRIGFAVGVGVGEDIATCLSVGAKTLAGTKGVISQPGPFGLVEELGDFTVNLRFFAWIDQSKADYFTTRSESIRRVKVAFDAAGIDMPEPTRRILQASWTPPAAKPSPQLEEEVVPEESPAGQVDEQIEQDRKISDEADLLRPDK